MKQELKEKYIERIGILIEASSEATFLNDETLVSSIMYVEKYGKWRMDVLQVLRNLRLDTYVKEFEQISSMNHVNAGLCIGMLQSIKESLEQGFFEDLETQVQISTYANFLELADHYLSEGDKNFAAVAASVALEDGMRKIARKNGIDVKDSTTLGVLIGQFRDKKVLSPLDIPVLSNLKATRDAASHANFDEIDIAHVSTLIRDTTRLLSTYL